MTGNMPPADLATFWREEDPSALQCLICHQSFTDRPLIRTIKLQETDPNQEQPACSRVVPTDLGQTVLLFDRHLQCLLDTGIHFAAVSHVWDREISHTQLQGYHTPQSADVTTRALSAPIRICKGFNESSETPDRDWEFWHDYYSVPQWTNELKSMILRSIHEVFSRAHTVIVNLDDVGPDVVRKLYDGTTTEERLEGLTGICNAKWFSRIWTAMELVRSSNVRTMISDGQFIDVDAEPVFLDKLVDVWADEVKKGCCVYCVENAAQMGKNLVPWNLGPLHEVMRLRRTNFAMSFAMLSLRGGRDRMDFLHAFRGIVVGGTSRPLEPEFWKEFVRTAKECLLVDDYSPLLITPAVPMEEPPPAMGFFEIWRWELGEEISPPKFPKAIAINQSTGQISVKLEAIGTVAEIIHRSGDNAFWGSDEDFSLCVKRTLRHSGPDLYRFVDSVGGRLSGEDTDFIMAHLNDTVKADEVRSVLEERYRSISTEDWPVKGDHGTEWLAEVMSLSFPVQGRSESRMALLTARYLTMHCSPYHHLLSITCDTCHQTSMLRAGAFVPQEELLGAKAFRIPGLQYKMSLPNGMALLVKDDRVVGRMLWATPACSCLLTEIVNLRLPKYMAPRPRSS